MEKISLYIAGKKVDLDSDSFILFNYTMEDLGNPTIVKNSFSKQITLKGTPANNEIFGNLFKADRKTLFGEGYAGVAFDPLRKTPFTIYNEMNEIIESGYVKVNSISKTKGVLEYKITLYGGLGSFFYGLTYNEDGNKRTLASLKYLHHDGSIKEIKSKVVNAENLISAWTYLKDGKSYFDNDSSAYWDIINFAPCYNGIPKDFDANKLLVDSTTYTKIGEGATEQGVTFGKKSGCELVLCTFTNTHTEWETRSIRPYLQRPVISIRAIIDAICQDVNNGGYIVELEEAIKQTPFYQYGWITLPDVSKENRNSENAITSVLEGSLTPCDYLIGIAKMYGLVFMQDGKDKKIRILTRDAFYSGSDVVDLSKRIDIANVEITPVVVESKWYQFGFKAVGAYAEEYKNTYGIDFGAQKINTGFEFNSEIKEITKDMPFISAAEFVERSTLYASYYKKYGIMVGEDVYPISIFEYVEKQLFNDNGESKNFSTSAQYDSISYFDSNLPYYDLMPKVQFCDKEKKSLDGSHCILYFNRIINLPSGEVNTPYYVTDDHPDLEKLNGGKQCWIINTYFRHSYQSKQLFWLPSFRRMLLSGKTRPYQVVEDANWGMALERAVIDVEQDPDNPNTLYSKKWKAYLTDRYDVDARVMKCKVNLSGMQVGQSLMRNFFFYENAIWVLNKISNHSITTDDLTECEFIKVKDMKNYTQGQKL